MGHPLGLLHPDADMEKSRPEVDSPSLTTDHLPGPAMGHRTDCPGGTSPHVSINTANSIHVALSKLGPAKKKRLSPTLCLFRTERRISARHAKAPSPHPNTASKAREWTTKLKNGVPAARWAHWEFKVQDTMRSNIWETFEVMQRPVQIKNIGVQFSGKL